MCAHLELDRFSVPNVTVAKAVYLIQSTSYPDHDKHTGFWDLNYSYPTVVEYVFQFNDKSSCCVMNAIPRYDVRN